MKRNEARILAKAGQLRNPLRSGVENVDPATAAGWLETSRGNRRISQEHVARLSEQMTQGRYILTHQGIAFDCDGRLIDGHHTLWAILLSGCTVDLMVTRNLRREAIRVIDTGKVRSLQDRLTMDRTWGTVTRAEASCLRRMIRGRVRSMKTSAMQEFADWKENACHVRFACNVTDSLGPGLKLAALRAVIARAHRTVPDETIQKFCWQIRNRCDAGLLDVLKGKSDRETYELTERALWSFSHDGRSLGQGDGF